jgi:hypothetical protein
MFRKITRDLTEWRTIGQPTSHLLPDRQTTRRCRSYPFAEDDEQSGEYRKNGAGISPTTKGEGREKARGADTSELGVFRSECAGENLGFLPDQLAKDGRDLFKFGRLIQEQIGAGS